MILIISVCREKLHELEFVKPVEKILCDNFLTKNYKDVTQEDLNSAEKVIICGTSLRDFEYLEHLGNFSWIKDFPKPVLGICAGMQIIGLTFGSEISNGVYIGTHFGNFSEVFANKFFDEGETVQEVYYLHKKIVGLPEGFEKLNEGLSYPTAFKHGKKEIYGVLFHPEVLNRELIEKFVEGFKTN